MQRRFPLAALLAALLLALAAGASAQQTHTVQMLILEVEGSPVPQFYFEPSGLHVQPGDTVEFVAATPHHTVTAYHPRQGKPQRVPDGVGPFSSPVVPAGGSWSYTFEQEGTYDIWCAPHEQYGMVMRIVAGEPGGPAEEAPADFSPMGTYGAAGAVLSDPALSSANIVEAGSVSWSDIADASKQAPAAPAAH